MSRIGTPIPFADLPYILQDEFGFVQEDILASVPDFDSSMPTTVYQDNGEGYAGRASAILKGNPHTYRVEQDYEVFVYSYGVEQWCIVGDDI